jgi:tetratricopeptide (TPR) repeat protein
MEQEKKFGIQSGGANISGGDISTEDIVGRDKFGGDKVLGDKIIQQAPRAAISALHQLPAPPADFTGRTGELAELLEAIRKNGVIISGLQGLGGVGKTALALKLAEKLKADYPDAQFYLDLKGVSSQPLTAKEAMARVIHAWHPTAQLPGNEDELRGLYLSVLDGKRALLVMDNARDAAQVHPLIPSAGCLLLVTSRQRFTLPGLFERDLNVLPSRDAVELLLRIAKRLRSENQDEICALARRCGYLPLALRSVGSALQAKKNISPAEYIRRLEDAQQRLKLTETDAALQSSYELLSERLKRRFRFLAVFPDTYDVAAAAAIWEMKVDDAQDRLSELFTYSLVDFDQTSRRYSLHDMVRLFAEQRLSAEERATAQKRHAAHYLRVITAADELYKKGGESVTKGLALFDAEWANIEAGHAWAARNAESDDDVAKWCLAYPHAGAHCLDLRRHPKEMIRWLGGALAVARRLKQSDREAHALGNLSSKCNALGEYHLAIKYSEQVLQIVDDRDWDTKAKAMGNLGVAYSGLANRLGIEYLEKALQIFHERNAHWAEATTLGNLGVAYAWLGENGRAREYHEQHRQAASKIGDRLGEGNALWNGAVVLDKSGNRSEAVACAQAALRILEAIEAPAASKVRDQLAKWEEEKGRGHAAE